MLQIVVLVVGLLALTSNALDPTTYTNFQQLKPKFQLYWRTDATTAYFGLVVETTGWIGFGFSEPNSGSMPGGDVVVSQVVNNVRTIGDYYITDYDTPILDDCQNWNLIAFETNVHTGFTSLEVSRLLNTSDPLQDRVITPGMMKIIYAWGSGNTMTYHNHDEGHLAMELIPATTTPLPDASTDPSAISFDLTFNNLPLVTTETLYVCQSFALPEMTDPGHHIIQIDPIIEYANRKIIHHLLVHLCDNQTNGFVPRYQQPGQCISPVGNPRSGCQEILYGYARGAGSLMLPPAAGFRVGQSPGLYAFLVLEVHFNSPQLGMTDNSGVRVWHTPVLRQYDAGTIVLGDPLVTFSPIPPAQTLYHYEAECPSECTSKLTGPINAFSSFLHAHKIGQQLWTTHYDATTGARIGTYTDRIDYFDFDFQTLTSTNFVINPGDRLNTHCTYTSTSRTDPTKFSLGSLDEMCMNFVSYYPKQSDPYGPFAFCGFFDSNRNNTANMTICGSVNGLAYGTSVLNLANPRHFDPVADRARYFGQNNVQGCVVPASLRIGPGFIALIVIVVIVLLAAIVGGTIFCVLRRAKQPATAYSKITPETQP